MATLNKDNIQNALSRLGELATQTHQTIELVIAGGALMVLGYQARLATKDVDALILSPPAAIVRKWVKQVALEQNLPEDWLNDAVKPFFVGITTGPVLFKTSGLTVVSPLPEQVLAMKLSAWRSDLDIEDAKVILQTMEDTAGFDSLWQRLEPYLVRGNELKAQYALMDLWEAIHGYSPIK
jgi:hypothetical protein